MIKRNTVLLYDSAFNICDFFSCPRSPADPDIRYCVLASLDERFDAHLAQAENLQALFVALNDEVFEIRELAICTIGRLSSMNPAFVMPFLRKMLIQVGQTQKMERNALLKDLLLWMP